MLVRKREQLPRTRAVTLAVLAVILAAATVVAALSMVGVPGTTALFSNQRPVDANLGAARIFRGQRDTPAFSVTDVSSGSPFDGSSSTAFASDSRYTSTVAWPAAFDSNRYIELDLNSPLPAGLTVSNGQLALRFAGDSGGTTACVYLEIRQISDGALLSTHGSSGSPLACATGTTYATATPSLGAIASTDLANNVRVRIYGRDSATGPIRLDQVVVSGDSQYAGFTLYPILTRDVHDGQTDLIRWGLAGS